MPKKFEGMPITTPPTEARFCHTTTPDMFKVKKGDKGKYKVDLVFDPDNDEHAAFMAACESFLGDVWEEVLATVKVTDRDDVVRQKLFKKHARKVDDEYELTGLVTRGFHSYHQPPMFDAKPVKIPTQDIPNGSTVCIDGALVPYYMGSSKTIGLTFYMNAVQIISLGSQGGGNGEGFASHEGGYTGGFESQGATAYEEDDIPF